jgi:hypothetical protein
VHRQAVLIFGPFGRTISWFLRLQDGKSNLFEAVFRWHVGEYFTYRPEQSGGAAAGVL